MSVSREKGDLSICTEARGTSIQGLTTLGCFSSSSTISPAVGLLVGVWEKHVRSRRALGEQIYWISTDLPLDEFIK